MPRIVYQFGDGRERVRVLSAVELLIELALAKYKSVGVLCRHLQVSRDVLRRWRTGKTRPRKTNIRRLALLVGVPANWADPSLPPI